MKGYPLGVILFSLSAIRFTFTH